MRNLLRALTTSACLAFSACDASDSAEVAKSPHTQCEKWEKVISRENSDAVLYLVEEGCSGLSNGMRVAVEVSPRNGQRIAVFKYQDASWDADYYGKTTPTVEWLDKKRLKISIGAVDTIEVKLETAGDIRIEYHIDHVIAEEPTSTR
jgi:hypothetical protein